MNHCKHKENLGGDNQPFILSCKRGWVWVGKDCEKTCMYKDMNKPPKITYNVHLTKKQIEYISDIIRGLSTSIDDRLDKKILKKLRGALE